MGAVPFFVIEEIKRNFTMKILITFLMVCIIVVAGDGRHGNQNCKNILTRIGRTLDEGKNTDDENLLRMNAMDVVKRVGCSPKSWICRHIIGKAIDEVEKEEVDDQLLRSSRTKKVKCKGKLCNSYLFRT